MNADSGQLPFGRVLIDGEPRHCRFTEEEALLLDRPAYEPGAATVGSVALSGATLLAPAAPTKVVAVGFNYRAHAEEFQTDVPEEPVLFLKPATSVVGPGQPILLPQLPPASSRIDYEAELALVVGRRCKDLTPAGAAGAVAGYTCANDVSARDIQKQDGQWTRAKGFDTFCPLGPWAVPLAPAPGAAVTASIDGRQVQQGWVEDMIVAPLDLLVFISRVMTLEAGDVVLTGTPPDVGPIAAGQTVTVSVDGVGSLSNPVEQAPAAMS